METFEDKNKIIKKVDRKMLARIIISFVSGAPWSK